MPTTTASKNKSSRAASTSSSASKNPNNVKVLPASQITNYTTALRWLYDHVDYERMRLINYNEDTFKLERMRKLLDLLGNPHEMLQCVQVAGTKGKGSTCAMLASMLQNCGYTVGLYSSPHLIDLRERITIDGNMVSYPDCADIFKRIASVEKALGKDLPTFFEIMTAAALCYFADECVDIVVLETGLGGRLDCTTVCDTLVTGITQISKDHTNLLGNKLTDIAKEKAGTFKQSIPAVSVPQSEEVTDVLKQCAEENSTPLQFTGEDIDFSFRFEANRELGPHTRVCVTTETSKFEHLPVPLQGEHQSLNCGLALAMIDKLKNHGFNLPEEKVIEGLAKTKLPGRMELVHPMPRVIIDGAHNAASIKALIKALGAHIAYDSLVLVFGCGQDKDINGMLQEVALGADKVIFTRAKHNPRAVDAEDLMSDFTEMSGKMAQCAPKLEDALRLASRAVSREDIIVVAGSFYLAGEARKFFLDLAGKKNKK
ncbi:Folylpolyglutamate synthase [Poriferisphaera corsica]|uniref:Dihydrofolate synthase/folylpolyglutamate synthase n=1 Tax=Poriferisphaera corsica TaxID=2528020 RepID=A0A517YRR1_9BACT|nr:folylpolyglutamate synthase/dihydrofolate synthase family protein [Poriferisphaera corsica]QDU32910.1 Folylpolyglutamate synthase [Poriferisphaera corsica]